MAEVLHGGDTAGTMSGSSSGSYDVRFEAGHHFSLFDRPGTFRLSQAGLALGDYLVCHLRPDEISGRILEIGTGSGAIALLLRGMGATSVTATDISSVAVSTAKQNELANFGDSSIDFWQSDLYPAVDDRFDLVVFNPPGWRSPTDVVRARLASEHSSLDLSAMFYGDQVLLRFLRRLPAHLAKNGRAIVGLNSLIGIADILQRARSGVDVVIHPRRLERIEFPLMFYTEEWLHIRDLLLEQFACGRQEYAATYVDNGDTINWFYEITEVTVKALTAVGQR